MAVLFNDIVGFVARIDLLVALEKEVGPSSKPEIREGAVLSAAASLSGMADAVRLPSGRTWLERELPAVPGSLDRVADLVPGDEPHRFGRHVITGLLGTDPERLAEEIAESSALTSDGALEVLTVTAWIAFSQLADRHQQGQDIESLIDLLKAEKHDFREGGWVPWLDSTLGESRKALDADRSPSGITPLTGTATKPATEAKAVGTALSAKTAFADGDGRPQDQDRYSDVEHLRPNERSRRLPLAAGLIVLLLVMAGAAALVLRSPDSGDGTASLDPAGASTSTTEGAAQGDTEGDTGGSTPSTTTVTSAEPTEETTTLDLTEQTELPEVVEYAVALGDPQGVSDAGGTLDLSLNTMSGEVCYLFDVSGIEAPYAAHLHIGPSAANGGITVDFGMVEQSDSGCVQAHPADVVAAVSSPSIRYVEAHDPSGAFTIRAQLEEGETGTPQPEPAAELDGRAHVVIIDGNVVLRGAVADQETLDGIVLSYRDLDGTTIQVIDEMRVEPGAEPPSDQVLIEDAVFFAFDSVEITDEANETLTGIATLMTARPDWALSVLGHTDSSGSPFYNFSLSLRRAQAVQQALIDLGAPQLAVTTEGFGPVVPRAGNETADGRAENRRIDFMIRSAAVAN